MKLESQLIRKALFDVGGIPLEPAFRLLGVSWPHCWIAVEVDRVAMGLTDPALPLQPGDFDILVGRLLANRALDFSWIAAIEAKRIPARANDELTADRFGTTQAKGLTQFGFDRALLLHIVDRERRADGYLTPFPQGDRAGFFQRLYSLVKPHLDDSYGWLPLIWTQHETELLGGVGEDLSIFIPPPTIPMGENAARAAREKLVAWLGSRPRRFFGPLPGAVLLEVK